MIRVGIIGYGYWGPNILRNFSHVEGSRVVSVCDKNPRALEQLIKAYPSIRATLEADELIESVDIDAVAIITPVFTHYELAKKVLLQGKHVLVEKPFTYKVDQAQELIELSEGKNLKIMVDHTFLFTGAVKKIKELIEDGTIGDLLYFDSMRVNLGLFQHDVNVVWDLAPHDLSILDYLSQEEPSAVMAAGKSHFDGALEDTAYLTYYYSNNLIAHINVNWLSPVKIRTTLIGGRKKMVVWNDLEPDNKIKIYDKGVEITSKEGVYDLLVSYRSGDMWAPKLEQTEALRMEAQHFIDCIIHNRRPISDGHSGLRVVKMLEAANRSLRKNGEIECL